MTKLLNAVRMSLMVAFIALAAFGFVGQADSVNAVPVIEEPGEGGMTCTGAGCNFGSLNCYQPPGGGMCYAHVHHN